MKENLPHSVIAANWGAYSFPVRENDHYLTFHREPPHLHLRPLFKRRISHRTTKRGLGRGEGGAWPDSEKEKVGKRPLR